MLPNKETFHLHHSESQSPLLSESKSDIRFMKPTANHIARHTPEPISMTSFTSVHIDGGIITKEGQTDPNKNYVNPSRRIDVKPILDRSKLVAKP